MSFAVNGASVLLFSMCAFKVLSICTAIPIVAYANNYDFVRQSSCVGVWQDYGRQDKTFSHPAFPINSLVFDGNKRPDVCLFSSDNLFPWVVSRLHGVRSHLQLSEIGTLKAVVALIMMLPIVFLVEGAAARLALSMWMFLVFGDFAVDCYFNTLYLEGSVVVFLVVAISSAFVMLTQRRPPGYGQLAFQLCALLWLALASRQYSFFSVMIGVFCAAGIALAWQRWRWVALMVAGSAMIFASSSYIRSSMNEHTRQIDRANHADTFLGAVLPASQNRDLALKIVGLPEKCASEIGSDWYSPDFQNHNVCPEVYGLSRARLLRLFIREPVTLIHPLSEAVVHSRPALLPYLGHFERQSDANRVRFRAMLLTSFSTALSSLSATSYFLLVLLSVFAGPLCLILFLSATSVFASSISSKFKPFLLMAGFGGLLSSYALFSSVFGDGYFEMQRHALGTTIGLAAQVSALVAAAVQSRLRES